MKNKAIIYSLASAVLLLTASLVDAEIKLPAVISSNMVLQRNAEVTLWGWADVDEEITVKPSWLGQAVKTRSNAEGKWSIALTTTGSKDAQSLSFAGTDSQLNLDNILFGEVWICSGQSNMEQPVKGFSAQPVYGSSQYITHSRNPNLRLFTVKRDVSTSAKEDLAQCVSWQEARPDAVANFSAAGYLFGKQLQEVLDVPVGLIFSTWGGSTVQAWMSSEAVSPYEEIHPEALDVNKEPQKFPTALFNAMMHPLIPYTIKGVVWYQGESNRHEPARYATLFPEMVKDWRTRWGQGDFPFYYVQVAPFPYGITRDAFDAPGNTAFLREVQLNCLDSIPNAAMAVTLDVGDENWIHPPKKKEVADRLLYCALNKTYGFKNIDSDGPVYQSHLVKDGKIELTFKHAENGLYAFDGLHDFEIAGEDRIFHPAQAEIVNRFTVVVESEAVPNPVAVRYGWKNWLNGSLFDANLLPASSFRTDDWDHAQRVNK